MLPILLKPRLVGPSMANGIPRSSHNDLEVHLALGALDLPRRQGHEEGKDNWPTMHLVSSCSLDG